MEKHYDHTECIRIYITVCGLQCDKGSLQYPFKRLKTHLAHSIQSKVSFEPEKGKVSIAGLKQVRCHQHPHMHVHWNELKDRTVIYTSKSMNTASIRVSLKKTYLTLTALAPDM